MHNYMRIDLDMYLFYTSSIVYSLFDNMHKLPKVVELYFSFHLPFPRKKNKRMNKTLTLIKRTRFRHPSIYRCFTEFRIFQALPIGIPKLPTTSPSNPLEPSDFHRVDHPKVVWSSGRTTSQPRNQQSTKHLAPNLTKAENKKFGHETSAATFCKKEAWFAKRSGFFCDGHQRFSRRWCRIRQ